MMATVSQEAEDAAIADVNISLEKTDLDIPYTGVTDEDSCKYYLSEPCTSGVRVVSPPEKTVLPSKCATVTDLSPRHLNTNSEAVIKLPVKNVCFFLYLFFLMNYWFKQKFTVVIKLNSKFLVLNFLIDLKTVLIYDKILLFKVDASLVQFSTMKEDEKSQLI